MYRFVLIIITLTAMLFTSKLKAQNQDTHQSVISVIQAFAEGGDTYDVEMVRTALNDDFRLVWHDAQNAKAIQVDKATYVIFLARLLRHRPHRVEFFAGHKIAVRQPAVHHGFHRCLSLILRPLCHAHRVGHQLAQVVHHLVTAEFNK